MQRKEPDYYTPEEVAQMFNTTGTSTNTTNGSGAKTDDKVTAQSVDDTDTVGESRPDNCNAPFPTGNCKPGLPTAGSGRRLLDVKVWLNAWYTLTSTA
jgi:hypothetical protein